MSFPPITHSAIFHASPTPMLIVGPDGPAYTMLDVNEAYLKVTHTNRVDLIGKSVFGVFPANPTDRVSQNIERTIFSFEQAIQTKAPHIMSNYRYDIPIPGTSDFEERYWSSRNTPVLDQDGEVAYLIHSPEDVTEMYQLAQREEAGLRALQLQRQQLHATFMQAPVGIAIFKGTDYVVELINPSLCELYGKSAADLIGKPVFEVLTHTRGIGFEPLLDSVLRTGESFKGVGMPVPLVRDGKLQTVYINFVYEPFREADGNISGVIAVATEVTELINAKNQLEEAEARARLAVDATGLGTFDLDLQTKEMITSVKCANIFGFENPVSRKEYLAIFHPDDLAQWALAHEQALETGKLMYEVRVMWKDDSIHSVKIEGKVFYLNKKPVRILGTVLDTTTERKAREEQRKMISLVENSVDLVSILNLDGHNAYINAAGRALLGFDDEIQVVSTPVAELHTPEDFQKVREDVIPSVMTKGKWSGTMLVKHLKTAEVFPVHNNCFRIDDPITGKPIAVGAVMRDLRPEYAAKQALAESEQLLRNVTSAVPTALWMTDERGALTYVNQTWVDWTGYPIEKSLGSGWMEAIHPEDRQPTKQKFLKAFAARARFHAEFRVLHKDGTMHWCTNNGQPQYRNDGSFLGYIGAGVDTTEQKFLQKQKDDFIGIASHELKTPVTTIKGYAQILEKMLTKKGDVKEAEMMRRMDLQVKRLTSLIGDLLDATKINAGKLDFNDAVFDFNDMVVEIIDDLERISSGHTIIKRLFPTGLVFGDRDRIGQVILNLVTNAFKYSPSGSEITVYTALKENEVTLCVQDQGIGIPSDKLDKVFEQFYRVSGTMQHTFPGLGLGLYISSEIIKREKGRIWVQSQEGKGSTFCFALPLHKTIH